MLATKPATTLKRPYPGLRSFEADEALLFHGRDRQTGELLRRLSQDRFLAVVGGSGSGKSSLVRAGLLPALYRGYLVGATSRWRVAVMRPGSAPLTELAKALGSPGALGEADEASLRESSFGLVNAVRAADLDSGESLLLVVDQFEELFRFRRESTDRDGGAEASLFVSQLLQAADTFGAAIYVVITMRSDFLGDCAQFPGLPEALNKGQYLIPRMTREQRREAITDALSLFDASMSDRLVQRLLNDTGDDPDQLPVLQHALQQTYAAWASSGGEGEIDLDHYTQAGTMEHALHDHAQSVYESTGESKWLAERIFRCLTVDENNRAVRRPAKLERILRVIGVAGDPLQEPEAIRIIRLFGAPEHSFLVWDRRPNLDPDSVIDISHESLIRKWRTLQQWVRDESKAVDVYRYVRRDAGLYPADAALWGDPELSGALRTRRETNWNGAWAEQYSQSPGASFDQVQEFLRLSLEERDRLHRREQWITRMKWGAAALVLLLIGGGIWGYNIYRQNKDLQAGRDALSANLNALQDEKTRLEEESRTRQKTIEERQKELQELREKGVDDPKRRAEIERLVREQERAQQSLVDRDKLIKAGTDQANQSHAESLKQISQLQADLRKAWDERDEARRALEKPTGKGGTSLAEVNDLRTKLQSSEQEVARLQQQLRTAAPVQSAPPASGSLVPLIIPEKSARVHSAASQQFAIVLGDLNDDKSASARLFVLPPNALTADIRTALAAWDRKASDLKLGMEGLAQRVACPSLPRPDEVQCFIVQKSVTNTSTEALGTVHLGPAAYTVQAMGWMPNALSVALVPAGRSSASPNKSSLAISEYSKSTTTATVTLGTLRQPRGIELADSLGDSWRDRYVFISELPNSSPGTVTLTILHSAVPIPLTSRSRDDFEKAASGKRIGGSKLEADSAITCKLPEGHTCWITDASGHKLGITAQSFNFSRTQVELMLRLQQ